MEEQLRLDGETFDPQRDAVRLTKQYKDVWAFMADGRWHTLHEVSVATGHPEASVSARLRDFRKRRFGMHEVERSHFANGLWMYRLVRNTAVTMEAE